MSASKYCTHCGCPISSNSARDICPRCAFVREGGTEELKGVIREVLAEQGVGRMMGYEYRSPRQIFGWPLLHVAKGFDPLTGRKRIARGIVAVGDVAIGGLLAIGGAAAGPIAIGGCAVGLFTLGGLSVGLLGALGGAAIGLGLSAGGGALGAIAVGGGAVGLFAYGGGAVGLHAYGGVVRDPYALSFWTDRVGLLPAGLWCVLALLAPLALILVLLMVAAAVARPDESFNELRSGKPSKPEPFADLDSSRPRSSFPMAGGCIIGVIFLVLIAMCGFGSLAVGLFTVRSSYRIEEAPKPAAVREVDRSSSEIR
jgi:hypothetical protein